MTVPGTIARPALWRPETVDQALALLREHGDEVKVVAGATAFTIAWKAGLLSARHLLACTGIPDLRGVEHRPDDSTLRIGAATRLRDVEHHPLVHDRLGVLAATLGAVANVRVRNAATLGGNLAEADYSSDPPAVLAALDARVRLDSQDGSRWVPLTEFFVDYYQTAIRPDELLTEVAAPNPGDGWGGCYLKCTSRSADDRTCLGVAAFAQVGPEGECAGLRLCVIGAAATPLRLPAVEHAFVGRSLADDLDDLAREYAEAADPVSDLRGSAAYRRRLVRALIPRAVRAAADGDRQLVRA